VAQLFKGDANERKFYGAGKPLIDALQTQKDLFFQGAFTGFKLGEMLYDEGLSPLANAIPREIFRESFSVIFDAFIVAGSAESYLTVFRNIFGEAVEVEFEVPGPGQLNIDITASGSAISNFVTRYIQDNAYVFDNIIDDEGDNIVFQTVKGFQSQYDLEQMLFEMVPDGIYTQISLTIGED